MKIEYFTGKGKRKTNQDFICIEPLESGAHLFLIVDGMGGYERGDEAARLIAENIFIFLNTQKDFSETIFQKAVNKANLAIRQFNEKFGIKSGATVGGVLIEKGKIHIFWVGDVMVAVAVKDKVIFKTKSHTLINYFRDNKTTIDLRNLKRYNHVVSRSVSGELSKSLIDYKLFEDLMDCFQLLICSDGTYNIISVERFFKSDSDHNQRKCHFIYDHHHYILGNINISRICASIKRRMVQ